MFNEKCTVFVKSIEGLENMELKVPFDISINDLKKTIKNRLPQSIISKVSISSIGGIDISPYHSLIDLYNAITYDHKGGSLSFIDLKLNVCLCGGKGGFGEMLKAKGHSMSKKKRKNLRSSSKDLYNTLDGRRVANIKKLQRIEEHMKTLDEQERVKLAEKKEKLQRLIDLDLEKNVKFEDNEFLEAIERQLTDIRESMDLDDDDALDVSDGAEIEDESEYSEQSSEDENGGESDSEFDNKEEIGSSSKSLQRKLVNLLDDSDEE